MAVAILTVRSEGAMKSRGGTAKISGDALPRFQLQLPSQVVGLVLVGAAYYLGARLGLSLSLVRDNVTPLWPPTGIAVAAFLLWGPKMWPAVGLAAFAVNLPISEGPLPAAVTAAGNVLAPLVAVVLLGRVGFRRQLDRRRDAVAIVFLGALASMLISATIGALTLFVSGAIAADELLVAWAVWWTGDAMGVLVVAPFLLCLPLFWERATWPWTRWVEGGTILVVVAAVTSWAAYSNLHLLFLALPVLGWASWRLQLRGAAPAALIASLVVTWSAAGGLGLFERGSLFEKMLTLQAFNACVALTSFFLAALVSDRIRAAEALEDAAAELEHRVLLRTAELSAANARLSLEILERSAAQVQLRRRQEWLKTSTDVTRQVLAVSGPEALELVAESVKRLADADIATVVLPTGDDRAQFRVAAVVGPHAEALANSTYPMKNTLSEMVLRGGKPILVEDASDDETIGDTVYLTREVPVGPVMGLPLIGTKRSRGAMVVGRLRGRPPFSEDDMEMATTFAGYASVALELADARRHQQRAELLEDRTRIGRDLHDHVIQQLFASGMTLQAVASGLGDGPQAAMVGRVINDLDESILQIRSSIFHLGLTTSSDSTGLRAAVLEVVSQLAPSVGSDPHVRFEGPLDAFADTDLANDVTAVVRETLTNVARHASATLVDLAVIGTATELTLTVRDDGVGLGDTTQRSGLDNIRDRAERRSGRLTLNSPPGQGTLLTWTVPLR